MMILVAKYHVRAGHGDEVLGHLQEMGEEVARNEPACTLYQVSRPADDPDLFLLYECYVDEQALLAHRDTTHFTSIIEGRVLPLLEQREREIYTLAIG